MLGNIIVGIDKKCIGLITKHYQKWHNNFTIKMRLIILKNDNNHIVLKN